MNKKIIFFDDNHSYWFDGEEFSSVGKYISPIFPEFESNYWKTHITLKRLLGDTYMEHYRALRKSTRRTMPPADKLFPPFLRSLDPMVYMKERMVVSDEWMFKTCLTSYRGTQFHNKMEKAVYDRKWMMNPFTEQQIPAQKYAKEFDNESLTLDLSTLPDGAYPELLVFDLDLKVAGQADMVFFETIDGIRYVDIDDWKTNEKKPAKSDMFRCNAPFQKEYASKHFKYEIQINLYAFLLSRHGFVPRHLAYTHVREYDEKKLTRINVRNLQKEINSLILS
jgi:hypothetical protein